jgi:hypothetical protein
MGLPLNNGGYISVASDCSFCNDWKRDHIQLVHKKGIIFMCPSNRVVVLYREPGRAFQIELNAREQKIFDLELQRLELESSLLRVKEDLFMYRSLYRTIGRAKK